MIQPRPFADIAVLIPAFNPDDKLIALANALIGVGCEYIVIVNDGSDAKHRAIFDALSELQAISIREHALNRGKGAALKTGFRAILDSPNLLRGVITADADGQHLSQDIEKLGSAAHSSAGAVLLGCRTFGTETPFRSWLGNRVTATLMTFVHGIRLSDTQTGLRYLPFDILPELAALRGDGYEFELQCLIKAHEAGYALAQIPISAVYLDGNVSSHFMPVIDSVRVYRVLFNFGGSSMLCFGVDIALFVLLYLAGANAMISTVVARTISGIANFSINKFWVFAPRDNRNTASEALRYLSLWLVLMLISATVVSGVADRSTVLVVLFKIMVDISLFLFSYYAQSRFVFAARR